MFTIGLDNGICVKHINKNDIPDYVMKTSDDWTKFNEDGTSEIQIAYWRKYWGLRGDILDVLHVKEPNDSNTNIDREDIPAILRAMKKYLHPDYFEDYADTIWTYDEAIDHMIDTYINLSWLYGYWTDHPEIEVRFYDSY